MQGVQQKISETVTAWQGVEVQPHRFGGVEFTLGKREIGHVHGNRLVDIPFPVKVRKELVAAGQVQKHHVLPESGWVSFYLRKEEDVNAAISLLKRSYDLAVKQKARREARQANPINSKTEANL